MTGGQHGGASPTPSALLSAALELADPSADTPDVDAVAAALAEGLGCRAVAIYARDPSGAWSLAGGRDDDGVGPALTAFEAAHGEAAWAPEGQRLPDPDGPCYVLPAPPLGVVVLIEGARPLDGSARHLAARVAAGLGRATAIERRRADAETASARATRLLDASTALLYEADPATLQVTYLSGAAERVLGVGSEAFESPDAWVERVHPDDRAAALGGMNELFEQGRRRHEYRLQQADGTYR
jgi:PAS domain-containing protein